MHGFQKILIQKGDVLKYAIFLVLGSVADWKKMLDVNVVGLNHCTQLAIKSIVSYNLPASINSSPPNLFFIGNLYSKLIISLINDPLDASNLSGEAHPLNDV